MILTNNANSSRQLICKMCRTLKLRSQAHIWMYIDIYTRVCFPGRSVLGGVRSQLLCLPPPLAQTGYVCVYACMCVELAVSPLPACQQLCHELSWKLIPFGIMGEQLMYPFKPHGSIFPWYTRGFLIDTPWCRESVASRAICRPGHGMMSAFTSR